MVLVATPGLHVALIDLWGATDVLISLLVLGLQVSPSFGIKLRCNGDTTQEGTDRFN